METVQRMPWISKTTGMAVKTKFIDFNSVDIQYNNNLETWNICVTV